MKFEEFFKVNLPEDWQIQVIDNIKSKKPNAISMGPFGSKIKKENFVDNGIPVIRGINLSEGRFKEEGFVYLTEEKANELRSANAFKLDLIFTHRGTLGQVGIIPEESLYHRYIVSQSQMKLTCDQRKANPHYVYYFFKSIYGQNSLLRATSTTGVPSISRPVTTLKNIEIPLPPIREQNQIVKTLLAIDKKIELNHQINQDLEEMAQAIFKSWFVDFEPFRDGEFVDSGLGPIPKGWRVGKLGELIEITSGKRPKRKNNQKNDQFCIPLIGASKVMGYVEDFLFDTPIIAIGRVGTLGVVQRINTKCWPSDNTLVINSVYQSFIYQVLGNIDYSLLNRGSTQPLITQKDLNNINIIIPDNKTLLSYEKIVNQFFEMIDENITQNQILSNLRDTLLPKLMSGEIRV